MFFFFALPRVIQAVIKRIVRLSGNERMAMVMDWVHEYTREEIDEALRGKQRIERDINHRWQVERLDACISPAYYHAAFKHEDDADMGLNADYTAIWNTLHFPAGVVPVTEVLPEEEKVYTDNYNDMITSKCRSNV
jgi:Asp-tRNA(Asn)/Glu-tRNA(Gln) amidotransferase A subunit family amidase